VRARITTVAEQSSGWASTLTAAELRLLPLLTTHLSFREIAERLFVSRNTVKTQAISVYRKLDASSRSEAIERAVELGLVDAAPGSRAAQFTRSG
jgi:LuxR family transcriptional regulator, maltose regulon positive regulatory protein